MQVKRGKCEKSTCTLPIFGWTKEEAESNLYVINKVKYIYRNI